MFASLGPGHIGIGGSIAEDVAMAKKHGFAGLDFDPSQVEEAGGGDVVKKLLADNGLKAGAWSLPFMPYMVSEEEWREGLGKIETLAKLGAAAGAVRAIMWILPSHDELDFEANFKHHVERFKPVREILDANGVRLGLEFVGPQPMRRSKKHEFIYDIAGALKLAAAVGPKTGILLDSYHWHTSEGSLDDIKALSNEQIVHVHVNDAYKGVPVADLEDGKRRLPGATGVIDIKGFMDALKSVSYDGPVTAEPFDEKLKALPDDEKLAATAKSVLSIMP